MDIGSLEKVKAAAIINVEFTFGSLGTIQSYNLSNRQPSYDLIIKKTISLLSITVVSYKQGIATQHFLT